MPIRSRRSRPSKLVTSLVAVVLAACSDGVTPVPTPGPAASASVVEAPVGSFEVGVTLSPPVSVRVVDAQGAPVPGVEVLFQPVLAMGSTEPVVLTDEDGIAGRARRHRERA